MAAQGLRDGLQLSMPRLLVGAALRHVVLSAVAAVGVEAFAARFSRRRTPAGDGRSRPAKRRTWRALLRVWLQTFAVDAAASVASVGLARFVLGRSLGRLMVDVVVPDAWSAALARIDGFDRLRFWAFALRVALPTATTHADHGASHAADTTTGGAHGAAVGNDGSTFFAWPAPMAVVALGKLALRLGWQWYPPRWAGTRHHFARVMGSHHHNRHDRRTALTLRRAAVCVGAIGVTYGVRVLATSLAVSLPSSGDEAMFSALVLAGDFAAARWVDWESWPFPV